MSSNYDLIVIGSGPGGYVGAIRAAQLGKKVAVVEKAEHLGGTCLNWGCIPTKSLLESAKIYDKFQHAADLGFEIGTLKYQWDKIQARKDKIVDDQRKGILFLMKKNKIDVLKGHGKLKSKNEVAVIDSSGKEKVYGSKAVLLAMGSKVRHLPFAKVDGKSIVTSDEILFLDKVPKSLCVVGGGVVGMEFASLYGRFGSEVTVVELADQVLPFEDHETVKELVRCLKKQNIKVMTGTKLSSVEKKGKAVTVGLEGKDSLEVEMVLLSIGREPMTKDVGLETCGVAVDKRGFVEVNERFETQIPGVFAIGDIINTPALAHTASAEAIHAAEFISGMKPHLINYDANPSAIYCYPEIASIGKTENTLKKEKIEYKVAKFPFAPMAKAKIEGSPEGFVKIIYEPKYREILGVHLVGAKATEMIAEFVLGKVLETTVDEIAHAIHPHPTLSEAAMEAAHVAMGAAIHM